MEKLYTVRKKTRQGADCGSDTELLIAKFRLQLKFPIPQPYLTNIWSLLGKYI